MTPSFQSLVLTRDCLSIHLIFAIRLLFSNNILFFVLVFELFLADILYGFPLAFSLILRLLLLSLAFIGLLSLLGNELMNLEGWKRCWLILGPEYFQLVGVFCFLLNFCFLFGKILFGEFEFFKAGIIILLILGFRFQCSFRPAN